MLGFFQQKLPCSAFKVFVEEHIDVQEMASIGSLNLELGHLVDPRGNRSRSSFIS